jgi:hypothetical protein
MRNQITLQTMATLTLMFFALGSLIVPSKAQARWHDRSEELPGMSSISTELVVLGVVTVAAVTYAVIKHSKKADSQGVAGAVADTVQIHKPDSAAQGSQISDPQSETDRPIFDRKEGKWAPYAGVAYLTNNLPTEPRIDMSKVEFKAGIRLSF